MTPDINPVELKVFLNHIYELKKGVRQMVLYTTNKRYEDFAVKRLRSQRIKFVIQPVDDERINLFFGKSASDIAPARHEKWELEKAPILFSVSSIRRISVGRKRDWHMVVLVVLDFEHHFDKRVERILLQPLEVGRHVIRQAVDALVVGRAFF